MIEVIKAWRRGKLLPKAKASMLLGLLSEFGSVRGVPDNGETVRGKTAVRP
jgi:hypothetical protein